LPSRTGWYQFLGAVFAFKRVRLWAALSATLFLVSYAFIIGVVSRSPYPLPPTLVTPSADLILDGPLGQVPWLVVYIDRYWVLSVSLEAGLTILALTALFGLNVGAMLYAQWYASCRCDKNAVASGFFVVPAFFAMFSCCGGAGHHPSILHRCGCPRY